MVKVIVAAQTPPPNLGQPIMVQYLVNSEMPGVEMRHVRVALSSEASDVGRFRIRKLLRLIPMVLQIVRAQWRERADILYYPPASATKLSMFRDFLVLLPTRHLFSKVVFHFHATGHATLYEQLSGWQRWLFRRTYFGADAAIRISELAPDDGRLVGAKRHYIVPNGIEDLGPRPPAARPAPGPATAERPLRLLFVSLLYEAKGLLVLIEACGQLAARGVPFRLEVMGRFKTEEFESRVRERIAELGIEACVSFLGQLGGEDKRAAFHRADVLCHPTYHDNFPVVIIEAMACEMPVVATRWSGIPSIVDDEVTGFLVEPRDPDPVAERLAELAADGELRQRMGRAGRERFVQEFTLARHAQRMRQVFLEVGGQAITANDSPATADAPADGEVSLCS